MKKVKNYSFITLISALMLLSGSSFAQNTSTNKKETSTDYQIMSRSGISPRPAGFQTKLATPVNGTFTENVVTASNRVLNKETVMLKKVNVQSMGDENFSAWQFLCDEGGHTYEQSAPNPLSYMVGGISSSLLTRVEESIKILDLNVKNVKVETKVFFRFDDPMTPNWKGFTDKVISNIIIESDESEENINAMKKMAIASWAVGECIMNPTQVDAQQLYNSKIWDTEYAQAGKVKGPDSFDDKRKITSKGEKPNPVSFTIGEDASMAKFTNPFIFKVVSISESANDPQRPYLHKIKIRAIQENYASWDVYSDDSRGFEGKDKAPSSRDYFTAGTSLCLMSQLTGWSEFYKHQGIEFEDYRVEHQFNYQVDDYMTPVANGHVDEVTTRILIKSNVSDDIMMQFAKHALGTCFAGEAITGATETVIRVYQNGEVID